MKIEKIYPRDIIAFFVLMFSLFLMYMGINSLVSGIVIMIITFYFSKRLYEERHPNGDLNKILKQLGLKINNNQSKPHALSSLDIRKINKEFQKTKEILES